MLTMAQCNTGDFWTATGNGNTHRTESPMDMDDPFNSASPSYGQHHQQQRTVSQQGQTSQGQAAASTPPMPQPVQTSQGHASAFSPPMPQPVQTSRGQAAASTPPMPQPVQTSRGQTPASTPPMPQPVQTSRGQAPSSAPTFPQPVQTSQSQAAASTSTMSKQPHWTMKTAEHNVPRTNNSEHDEQIVRLMQEELNQERQRQVEQDRLHLEEMLRAEREEQDRLHLEELIQAEREEQEQQDRMFALTVQESLTQEEIAKRGGQHVRNRGRRGVLHQNRGHRSQGMTRGLGQERTNQETIDQELALSLQREEDARDGAGNRGGLAGPTMVPPVAPQSAGILQDYHQMQQERRRTRQEIQQAVAARQQELQHHRQSQLRDLNEAQLEFQNHHRRLWQMGRRGNFVRVPAMFDVPGLSNVGNSYESLLELGARLGNVSRGLTIEECSTLPTERYTQRDGDTADCSVCMEEYKTGDTQKRLPCLHIFHDSCIDPWLKDNATCPVCREVVKVS
ncbi:involucrin-like [Mya arenaria]|uniref:involucrin-like n=1 Tax=Mya arenaria TaxID=6604 RepID=UPI0022E66DB9|nr:involucrin-like [Mya arenaria]